MQHILSKIKEYQTIIIHGHTRPDGDCYGAQFGLKDIIKTNFQKEVYVVGQKSEYVSFIGEIDQIPDSKYQGALAIVVDTAIEDRISDKRYKLAKEIIKIDHHIPIDQYGNYQWIDVSFPSCAQMIAYFAYTNNLKITKHAATAMYTGILTDTGRFRFRGVSKLTHEMAGLLVDQGIDIREIDKNLSKEPLSMIKYKGYIYKNLKFTPQGFIYCVIPNKIIKKLNISLEQASSAVNILSGIEGYNVWALFIEYSKKEIRVRLRSSGVAIDKVANKFRGGGHQEACGATLLSLKELPEIIKEVNKIL